MWYCGVCRCQIMMKGFWGKFPTDSFTEELSPFKNIIENLGRRSWSSCEGFLGVGRNIFIISDSWQDFPASDFPTPCSSQYRSFLHLAGKKFHLNSTREVILICCARGVWNERRDGEAEWKWVWDRLLWRTRSAAWVYLENRPGRRKIGWGEWRKQKGLEAERNAGEGEE